MKIYINRQPVKGPWGGGNMFVTAFHEMVPDMGHKIVNPLVSMAIPDVILCVGLASEPPCFGIEQAIIQKILKRQVKVVLRVNENDARKNTSHVDRALRQISQHLDGTVFVSQYMADYFRGPKGELQWDCPSNTKIINGVDHEIFKPGEKLNNGKINIVTHHWSDNRMKGADVYEALDQFVGRNPDRFTFTYIGRTKSHLPNSTMIGPLSGRRLGVELGKYDLYVSGSRHDPGPNHILEAIACRLPTYVHADGGGCVEFAGVPNAFESIDQLLQIIEQFDPERPPTFNAVFPTSWEDCIADYIKYLEEVVNG